MYSSDSSVYFFHSLAHRISIDPGFDPSASARACSSSRRAALASGDVGAASACRQAPNFGPSEGMPPAQLPKTPSFALCSATNPFNTQKKSKKLTPKSSAGTGLGRPNPRPSSPAFLLQHSDEKVLGHRNRAGPARPHRWPAAAARPAPRLVPGETGRVATRSGRGGRETVKQTRWRELWVWR